MSKSIAYDVHFILLIHLLSKFNYKMGILKKNLKFFLMIGKGRPLYLLSKCFCFIFTIKESNNKMGASRKKLLDYYFRIAYESYYLQLDLKQAYKYRLLHFLCIKDSRLPGDILGDNFY